MLNRIISSRLLIMNMYIHNLPNSLFCLVNMGDARQFYFANVLSGGNDNVEESDNDEESENDEKKRT